MSNDERWTDAERRARQLFDASVDGLDGETRSRLNRARQAALEEIASGRVSPWRSWLPAAAAASIALLAVALWRMPTGQEGPAARSASDAPAAEVVEMLAIGEGLDVASEDPEFYVWLESRDLPAGNGAG
jgi:hypothetical protein